MVSDSMYCMKERFCMKRLMITGVILLLLLASTLPTAQSANCDSFADLGLMLNKPEIVAVLEAEIRLTETRQAVLANQKSALLRQIGDARTQMELTRDQTDDLDQQILVYQRELAEFKLQADDDAKQTEDYIKAVESFENQIDALRRQLGYLSVEFYDQIPDIERQIAILDGNIRSLATQKQMLELRVEHEYKLAEYYFERDYYALCLLHENASLFRQQLELIDKHIEADEIRLHFGMITQDGADQMAHLKEAILLEIKIIEDQIASDSEALLKRADGFRCVLSYQLPSSIESLYEHTLDVLMEAVLRNNRLSKEYDAMIANQQSLQNSLWSYGGANNPYHREAVAQNALYLAQRDEYRDALGLFVSYKYLEYKRLEAQYLAAIQGRRTQENRLSGNESKYEHGIISEIEYMSVVFDIRKSEHETNALIAALIIAAKEIKLLEIGIAIN